MGISMEGETDLETLLESMRSDLHEQPYVFCSVDRNAYEELSFKPIGTFCEKEGMTVIATKQQAIDNSLPFDKTWACVTLAIHSSLSAVGFLAAITGALARAGISVNPISAFFHDHLFVPWESRWQAMDVLSVTASEATLWTRTLKP